MRKTFIENILAEIEHEAMTNKAIGRKQCEGMERAANIIRSHMDVSDINAGKWIPVEERLPEPGQRVIATLKHHRWISDYDSDWVPPEEQREYPEYTETKEVLYKTGNRWEYEDDEYIMTAYTNPKEDISFPVVQVTAWQPLPEPYQSKVPEANQNIAYQFFRNRFEGVK